MKLELKHIVPYLPYGLKCRVKDKGKTKFSELSGIYNDCSCVFFDIIEIQQGFSEVKPILRPLSDLTKEIDGVVGIVELAKIAFPCIVWELEGKHAVSSGINGIARKKFSYINTELTAGFSCINDAYQRDYIPNQLDLFSYLFENHYDVSGLIEKGLAVDINTIEK